VIRTFRRLLRQAFPGFPEHYTPRLGEVVAIADAPAEEQGTDRFRPRYAVDVQPLTPAGEPHPIAPILRGLPLPVTAAGQGRGIFGFPDLGARVLYAFAYGLPSHPQILAVYPQGQAVPAVRPGELLIQQADGAFLRFDRKGNVTLQTAGELRQDSRLRTVEADEAAEAYGTVSRTVDGDLVERVGGQLAQTVLGALLLSVGGDVRTAIVGGEDRTVGGDKSELVGGKLEAAAQLSLTWYSGPASSSAVVAQARGRHQRRPGRNHSHSEISSSSTDQPRPGQKPTWACQKGIACPWSRAMARGRISRGRRDRVRSCMRSPRKRLAIAGMRPVRSEGSSRSLAPRSQVGLLCRNGHSRGPWQILHSAAGRWVVGSRPAAPEPRGAGGIGQAARAPPTAAARAVPDLAVAGEAPTGHGAPGCRRARRAGRTAARATVSPPACGSSAGGPRGREG
jgi:hypothetical protein